MTESLDALDGTGGIERLLLNSTAEGIYGVDLDGKCTFANPACLRLLGFESDADLLGRNMHELVHHTRPNGDPYPMNRVQDLPGVPRTSRRPRRR